uniref:Uncharacterized protein n=1 Tax=Meloidogyne enterolobii TaxID=390850 RepID=A0A6V7W7V2_MELEN|nr:unnamed protein product [Meloidogyne enterolobii]
MKKRNSSSSSSSSSSLSSFSSSIPSKGQQNVVKQLSNKLAATCQLELRRVSLLLLLIAGTTFEQAPSCLAIENEAIDELLPASQFYESSNKRAGARAFQRPDFDDASYELKRGGARTFLVGEKEVKRGGARPFYEEKRGGARPFYGFFGGGEGTWKRGGGRYFIRPFADQGFSGVGAGGWAKRGGGRQFSADKRAGGRSFFGSLDSAFDSTNYWVPPRQSLP